MTDIKKNMAASARARLYNLAKTEGINFDRVLLLYLQERLLYRLSVSTYRDNFYLKGGLLILSRTSFKTRPTRDVDFLARHVSNDPEKIRRVFREICSVKVNDGVTFDLDSISAERITEDADYEGIRIKVRAYLGDARKLLQLDIGFSDTIVPSPSTMEYPTLLDQGKPSINTYSMESVVAEKFEAMLRLSVINSRMKDFYDIFTISGSMDFDGRVLQEAVDTTLQKRGTPLKKEPAVFREEFHEDERRKNMWERYLERIGKEFIAFPEVMARISSFLLPVFEHVLAEDEFFKSWDGERGKWT